jgi:uncharacterized protein
MTNRKGIMGAVGVAATVAAMLSLTPAAAEGPSFGCTGRLLPTEAVICSDETLSALDRALAASYKRKFDSLSASQRYELESAEKVWLAERNTCGTNKSC